MCMAILASKGPNSDEWMEDEPKWIRGEVGSWKDWRCPRGVWRVGCGPVLALSGQSFRGERGRAPLRPPENNPHYRARIINWNREA